MQAISKVEGSFLCYFRKVFLITLKSTSALLFTYFFDSAQFLIASLDKQVSSCNTLTAKYKVDKDRRQLLTQKGIYAYEYVDSWTKFDETKLPPRN